MISRCHKSFLWVLFVLFLLPAACQTVPERKNLLEERYADVRISTKQLWILLNDFVGRFMDQVEEAGDKILMQSEDLEVQRNALLWKINAIPACFRAASQEEPSVAFADIWVLCKQMTDFFESDRGKDLFGPLQQIAVDASKQLEGEIREIAEMMTESGDLLTQGEFLVDTFVEENPLESLYFVRKSVVAFFIEDQTVRKRKLFEIVGTLTENLVALQDLMMIYADHLPDQARWQAQLLLMDITKNPTVSAVMEDVDRISASVQSMSAVVEEFPKLIKEERTAVVDALHKERLESFEEVERMRTASFGQFDQMRLESFQAVDQMRFELFEDIEEMRLATMKDIQGEREVVLDTLREERAVVLDYVDLERKRVTKDIEALVQKTMEKIVPQGERLIDHFFWRTVQLFAVLAVVGLISIYFLRRKRAQFR